MWIALYRVYRSSLGRRGGGGGSGIVKKIIFTSPYLNLKNSWKNFIGLRIRFFGCGLKYRILTKYTGAFLATVPLSLCSLHSLSYSTRRKFTQLDAPSPRGGSCRYISRFASQPTKAVRQLQLTGARQAECLSPIIKVLHM